MTNEEIENPLIDLSFTPYTPNCTYTAPPTTRTTPSLSASPFDDAAYAYSEVLDSESEGGEGVYTLRWSVDEQQQEIAIAMDVGIASGRVDTV